MNNGAFLNYQWNTGREGGGRRVVVVVYGLGMSEELVLIQLSTISLSPYRPLSGARTCWSKNKESESSAAQCWDQMSPQNWSWWWCAGTGGQATISLSQQLDLVKVAGCDWYFSPCVISPLSWDEKGDGSWQAWHDSQPTIITNNPISSSSSNTHYSRLVPALKICFLLTQPSAIMIRSTEWGQCTV